MKNVIVAAANGVLALVSAILCFSYFYYATVMGNEDGYASWALYLFVLFFCTSAVTGSWNIIKIINSTAGRSTQLLNILMIALSVLILAVSLAFGDREAHPSIVAWCAFVVIVACISLWASKSSGAEIDDKRVKP